MPSMSQSIYIYIYISTLNIHNKTCVQSDALKDHFDSLIKWVEKSHKGLNFLIGAVHIYVAPEMLKRECFVSVI